MSWKMHCCQFLQKPISIVGAGRTDAGVHAHQLFAHVDLDVHIDQDLTFRLNKLLKKEIAVRNILAVPKMMPTPALMRLADVIRYHVTTQKNPFLQKRSYHFSKPLDVELMNQAAKILIDHEDFKCFSKSKTDVKTYICDIQHAHWQQNGSELVFSIQANRFLRNMVRAIVGTLIEVGLRKISNSDFESILTKP